MALQQLMHVNYITGSQLYWRMIFLIRKFFYLQILANKVESLNHHFRYIFNLVLKLIHTDKYGTLFSFQGVNFF